MKPAITGFILTTAFIISCSGNSQKTNPNHTEPQLLTLSNDPAVCADSAQSNALVWEYLQEWYLWNESLPSNFNSAQYQSTAALIEEIKKYNNYDLWSTALPKTRYSEQFLQAQSASYGIKFGFEEATQSLRVFVVYPNSPADQQGLQRGDRISAIDGIPVADLKETTAFENLMMPGKAGVDSEINVTWQNTDGEIRQASIARAITQHERIIFTGTYAVGGSNVGYLVYDMFDHASSANLNHAIVQLKKNNIDTLILDLRYNPGGMGHIANQLASQIAGENVRGETFNYLKYNDLKSSENHSIPFTLLEGQETLHLDSLIVLTSTRTASASELLINSLRPHINVVLIGEQTSGKPVGMRAVAMCEEVIFAVTQHNLNSEMQGDYFGGLDVDCPVEDSVTAQWGELDDRVFNEALYWLENGKCSE